MFGYGLRAEFTDLLYLFRRPALLVRSLIAVLVVMPAVAVVLARWFDFAPTVEIALVALAISPLPPLLPTREAKAGGGERYGLGLMVVLALLVHRPGPAGCAADRRGLRPCVRRDARNDRRRRVHVDPPAVDGRHGDPGRRCAFADAVATQVERVGKVFMPVAAAVLIAAAAPTSGASSATAPCSPSRCSS